MIASQILTYLKDSVDTDLLCEWMAGLIPRFACRRAIKFFSPKSEDENMDYNLDDEEEEK